MPEGQVLEFSGISKRFGSVSAVDDLSARIEPGLVTGFLGPNGAGKTTTLRMLLGLVRPTSGRATIGGQSYAQLRRPLQSVGAVLEASSFHPGRTAANHLAVYAQAASLPRTRIDEVLGTVGLADVAGRKVGGFSLGMRQRLGLAYALLGDPGVLVLDEPVNGLDPEGIRWMRSLLRSLAEEGRTVLISSHLLAEVQQTVDSLLIIAGGRLVFSGDFEDLADPDDYATVVDAPDRDALVAALEAAGLSFETLRNGLTVRTAEPAEVGAIAAAAGIALSTLQRKGAGLEEVFLELVSGARVHPSAGGVAHASDTGVAAASPVTGSGDSVETGESGADDPVSVTPPDLVTGDEDAATAGAADAPAPEEAEWDAAATEPPTSTASFTVASTGVIDIVPPAEGAHADAAESQATEQASEQEDVAPAYVASSDASGQPDASDDAWLADRSPFDAGSEEGDIRAPELEADGNGDRAEDAPQNQPEQPSSMTWAPEPIEPDGPLAEGGPDDAEHRGEGDR